MDKTLQGARKLDAEAQLINSLKTLGEKVDKLGDKIDSATNNSARIEERHAALVARVVLLEADRCADRIRDLEQAKIADDKVKQRQWDVTKSLFVAVATPIVGLIVWAIEHK